MRVKLDPLTGLGVMLNWKRGSLHPSGLKNAALASPSVNPGPQTKWPRRPEDLRSDLSLSRNGCGRALISARAARNFLLIFGALYLADGLMGLAVGSGYLDLGIINNGVLDLPFTFKIMANAPHILLGGVALWAGLRK